MNKVRIVGSTALKWWRLSNRYPKDIDVWSNMEISSKPGYDIATMPDHIIDLVPEKFNHATPDALYTIKCSHLGWSNPAWQKHKLDVIWLKSKGCEIIEPLYEALTDFWKGKLGDKSFLNLDKSKEQFFTDEVYYKYDHDYLHELVAHPYRPMYESCLKNGKEVLIDRDKWDKLPFENKVRMFREEITVIAIERWLVNPHWSNLDWYRAYLLSLQKTITNLTKGWATDFIVRNLEEFYKPDFSYFKHALDKLDIGDYGMNELLENLKNDLNVTSSDDDFVVGLADGGTEFDVDYPEGFDCPDGLVSYEERKPYYDKQTEWFNSILEKHGYEHVMQEGGGEGGSEYCEGVFKLGDKYFHASWRYYSYHGYETGDSADTVKEVFPKQKTVTVWE